MRGRRKAREKSKELRTKALATGRGSSVKAQKRCHGRDLLALISVTDREAETTARHSVRCPRIEIRTRTCATPSHQTHLFASRARVIATCKIDYLNIVAVRGQRPFGRLDFRLGKLSCHGE